MSIWAGIHWRVHDLTNAPMKNRSELISWVSPIFPSLMALRADLQSESTMMPSELEIFVRVSDEAHFWLNGYVSKQNCRIWSEANPQVYVETPLHPEKLTVWCALWAGGILLQKR
ncbi:uncharacterized protein TNCV_2008091 [Trichonephila clavipes]|nr:uncharacterized protein TNCV_2008091 [Trichonephila clavipes]